MFGLGHWEILLILLIVLIIFGAGKLPKIAGELAKGIKSLNLDMWNGDAWRTDWDTEKSEFKQSTPKMVRISLVGYTTTPFEGEEDIVVGNSDFDSMRLTVVYLPYSNRFPELKDKTGSMNL